MSENYLTLKWGTLKSWNFDGNQRAMELLNEYEEIGSVVSVMLQEDTTMQKKILCELIDLMPNDIYIWWLDKKVSKEIAKKYVMEYNT